MKKLFLLLIIITAFNCKAQTPILPFKGGIKEYGSVNNAYYKDLDNELNPYVGTWISTNGTNILKIILQKKMVYLGGGDINFHTDYIVGEYEYIENGTQKLNTLPVVNHEVVYDYNLQGSLLIGKNTFPLCPACSDAEKRLRIIVNEPLTKNVDGLEGSMVLHKVIEGGVEKLKGKFYQSGNSWGSTFDDQPTTIDKHTIPYGDYTFIKQP